MIVRKATEEDAKAIADIAQSLKLDLEIDPTFQANGFLVYPLTEEQYRDRITLTDGQYFYVEEDNQKVQGFLMAYDDDILHQLVIRNRISHQDNLVRLLFEKQKGIFIFADQISVRKELSRCRIGQRLIYRMLNDARSEEIEDIYGGVLYSPRQNLASVHFCYSLGFSPVNQVQNPDGTVWDVFHRRVK